MNKKLTPQELRDQINKELGENVIKLGSDPSLEVEYIPTGVGPIDYLLGGGLPRGRSVEIYGDYSSLKSYIGLCSCAIAQQSGLDAAIVDTEHAFDPVWAESLGVDSSSLVYMAPESGEAAVDATVALVRGGIDLIVWDSVAATLTKTEGEKSARDTVQPARLAAFMSLALRRINAYNQNTALLWINQTRLNVGITFGNPVTTPGGKSLPFYASMRVALFKGTKHKDKRDSKLVTGQRIRASLEKSKLSKPHRQVEFDFMYGDGIDESGFLFDLALSEGVISQPKKGVYEFDDLSIHGRPKFVKAIEDNENLFDLLWGELSE